MSKKETLGALSALSFASILFTPVTSDIWKGFLIFGLVFGSVWFFMKNS